MNKIFQLNTNWQFSLQSKRKNTEDVKRDFWYNAEVPGTIYHNLIREKLIPDPFYADNELRLQWIAQSDWSYKTSFKYPGEFNTDKPVSLVFEGLDTIADVILNGKKMGTSDNMFRRFEFEITKNLKADNILEVKFHSPYKYANKQEFRYGKLPVALNSERVYIRKAQYSFGWDWGPSFADMGIWKPVYLIQREEFYIRHFTFNTTHISKAKALSEITLYLNGKLPSGVKIKVNISDSVDSYDFIVKHGRDRIIHDKLKIPNPKLWYPNGEGEQHLYNIKVSLVENNILHDEVVKTVGIRKIELRLEDNGKNTFHFLVNGKRIFAKGANWIPADSFLTRINKEKYFKLLLFARSCNMNFIRVWGGGIYEHDDFYNICDQLGLIVWQDFMFACAAYPDHKKFLINVADEVRSNVSRIQHHPSVAIWCGNNENEWIWYQGKRKSYKKMPGYKIYNRLIPGILKEIDPGRPYWQSSPFGNEEDPNSPLSGNRHQWKIWSNWVDYKEVIHDHSLFVTEFGFQGPANQSTFEKVIPFEERSPRSYLFEFHNKQVEGNERIFRFLSGHLPVKTEWKDFIYLAQLNQGLALKTCLEHWRFNYPHTNGSVIWQLNDCWPVTSWALIDSDQKPKLSYYFVKSSFQNTLLKIITAGNKLNVFLLNYSGNSFKGQLEISEIALYKGNTSSKKIKVNSKNEKTQLHSLILDDEVVKGKKILVFTLYDSNKGLVHRTDYAFPEWKYLHLPEVNIKSDLITKDNEDFLSIKSDKPAFFVSVYDDNMTLDHNGVTVLPGEELLIHITSKPMGEEINYKIFSLNKYLP